MSPKQAIWSWLIGLGGVSLILGSLVTWHVWKGLHCYYRRTAKTKNWEIEPSYVEKVPVIPFFIGVLERVMFTLLVAFWVPGVGGGIFTWMAVKMLTGWNRIARGETQYRMLGFTGLLSSLTSMLFAVVGGLVCNGRIPVYQLFQ